MGTAQHGADLMRSIAPERHAMEQNKHIILFAIIVGVLIAVIAAKHAALPGNGKSIVTAIIVVGGFVLFIMDRFRRWKDAQHRELEKCANRLGLQRVSDRPERGDIGPIPKSAAHLRVRHAKVRHLFAGQVEGLPHVRVFEHAYTVSAGQVMLTMMHRVGVVDVIRDWPRTRIYSRRASQMNFDLWKKIKPIELESSDFNRRYRVDSEDDDFAVLLMDPALQQRLLDIPRSQVCIWHIADGRLWYLEKGGLTAPSLETLLQRLQLFLDGIHPELHRPASEPATGEASPDAAPVQA